jgi:hypothetical protein
MSKISISLVIVNRSSSFSLGFRILIVPALLDRALVTRDELSDPGAVHERDFLEVDEELLLSHRQQVLNGLAHLEIARSVCHTPLADRRSKHPQRFGLPGP